MNDIVYFLREGKNQELIYSLRSVEQNFPYKRVIFYGGKPTGLTPDRHVSVNQDQPTKWQNVQKMMKTACQDDEITPNFWLFNDDFFVMRKQKEPKNYYDGTLQQRIAQIEKVVFGQQTQYTRQLRQLREYLKHIDPEHEPLNYATHMPMLINRKKMLKIIEQNPDQPMLRALYGNLERIPAENHPDVKFVQRRQPFPVEDYASTTDESFRYEIIGTIIRDRFKKPSRFENG